MTTAKAKPKTINDFLAENDRDTIIRNKITTQLAAMLKISPEQHDSERDFCTAAGVNTVDLVDFRDEFRKYVAYVPKILGKKARYVWFADPRKVPAKFRYNPES